jgi:hypothetical protein
MGSSRRVTQRDRGRSRRELVELHGGTMVIRQCAIGQSYSAAMLRMISLASWPP